MAQIKIPHADNPFGIGVDIRSTHEMGMSAVPETQHGGARMAKELESAAKAWQMEVEDTLAQDLMNELEGERLKQQDDPETGWSRQLGKNALERESGKSLTEEAQENFKKSYETIRQKAGTQRVRRLLDNFYKGADVSLTNNVNAHVNKQFLSYQADTDQATLNNALAQGLSDNPEEASSGLAVSRAVVEKIYKRAGLEPDYSKGPGVIHAQRLGKMYDDGDVKAADEYFEANKHEMSAEQIAQLQRVQKAAQTEADIESQAQKIITTHGDTKEGMIKALREANKLAGTKEGKHVNARVKQHYALLEEEWKLRGAQAAQVAMKELEEKGKIPPSVMEDLKEYAPETYSRIQKFQTEGVAKESNTEKYTELMMLKESDPVAFSREQLNTYRSILTEKDLNYLKTQQKNLGSEQMKHFNKLVEGAINKTPSLKKDPQAAAEFRASCTEYFAAQFNARKEPFKLEELSRMIEGLRKGYKENTLVDDAYPLYKQLKEPAVNFYFDVGVDKSVSRLQADYPDAFKGDKAKRAKRARELFKTKEGKYLLEHYYIMGFFPADEVKKAREALQIKMDREYKTNPEFIGKQKPPITQKMINEAIIQLKFDEKK